MYAYKRRRHMLALESLLEGHYFTCICIVDACAVYVETDHDDEDSGF